jgi:hypothetical protein
MKRWAVLERFSGPLLLAIVLCFTIQARVFFFKDNRVNHDCVFEIITVVLSFF